MAVITPREAKDSEPLETHSALDDVLVYINVFSDDDVNESFVIKSKPKKVQIDSRLLSGFCLEAAVPLEEGRNVETLGVIVGRRLGRNIQMTRIIIPNQDNNCQEVASWVMKDLKPWGKSTEVIGVIVTHISNQ